MPSPLEIIANSERPVEISRNSYLDAPGSDYGVNHPNALSTGDEKGKGETVQGIGSSVDISERNIEWSRNRFNPSYNYPDF